MLFRMPKLIKKEWFLMESFAFQRVEPRQRLNQSSIPIFIGEWNTHKKKEASVCKDVNKIK